MCKMKLGLSAVLCLTMIYVLDVCNAKCDEYFIVFEEQTHPFYRLIPLKIRDVNWDNVVYPHNSTDKNPKKKECVVEFDCIGTTFSCQNHIKVVNHQTHALIEEHHTAKYIDSRPKAPDEPKINITEIETTRHIMKKEFNATYDINLIYFFEDKIQNRSETSNNKSKFRDQILQCDYAETICVDEGNPENKSLSDVIYETLQISINRDKTSPVQPIFTGYLPQSTLNTDPIIYNNNFTNLKTVTLRCNLFKDKNCKPNIKNKFLKLINIYIKTNYIQNNTKTKYPNCTSDTITSEKKLNVKCEDILFTKHNQHILISPPPKPELTNWTCQITEYNESITDKKNQIKIYFNNCFNATNVGSNQNKDNTVTAPSDSEKITIYNDLEKDGIIMNNTESTIENKGITKDNLTKINPENVITILIKEKENNCTRKSTLNIHEGKIIDLGINNNKNKILQNNNIELRVVLSNCINTNISIINETQVELMIILKNGSLNTSNLKQFNGTLKEDNYKQRILLRCDHLNRDSSSNITDKTMLQCESIDLDLYNITGIEINSNLSQTSNGNNTEKKNDVNIIEANHNKTKEVKNNSDTNKTAVFNDTTAKNKSTVNNTNVVENKEVLFNISERQDSKIQMFTRRKDIANGTGDNSLAQRSTEAETIILITLLSIVVGSILIVIAIRICTKKTEYHIAPTREPPDEQETAF